MKPSHSEQLVPLTSVSLPSIVITYTPKWLLDAHIEETKNNKNCIPESIPVVVSGDTYVVTDKFDWFETAVSLKLDSIPIIILNSAYSPLLIHIKNTEKARVNPIRKARAIISITNDMPQAKSSFNVLNLSPYYSTLIGKYKMDSKAAKKLEELIDTAISLGVVANEPPLKFFEQYFTIDDYENAIGVLSVYLTSAHKSNFLWLPEMLASKTSSPSERNLDKKAPSIEKFDCECGKKYVVDSGNVSAISEEIEGFSIARSTESEPQIILSSELLSYLGLPDGDVPVVMQFASGTSLAKKLSDLKQRFVVFTVPFSGRDKTAK
jgi:hypothetical protein